MDNVICGKVDVGDIVGFITPFSPHSKAEFALVLNERKIIPVPIDDEQRAYVKDNYSRGKKVAIGYYSGRWHIGMPAIASTMSRCPEDESPPYDLKDEDIIYLQSIRRDFSTSADGVLEQIGLSHMKAERQE